MTEIIYKYSEVGACPKLTPQTINTNSDVYQTRIQSYIDKWNHFSHLKSLLGINNFSVRIVYHKGRDLYSGNEYDFAQKDYDLESERNKTIIPTIHLTLFDIFTEKETGPLLQSVQRYKKIIDSSIWNFYVPIIITDDDSTFVFTRFDRTLMDIGFHYAQGHYGLNIAREYTDLNARLCQQCHLNGDHNAISPFIFHSENEMKVNIDEYKKEGNHNISLKTIRDNCWRFLLLDDKGVEKMSAPNGIGQDVDVCKLNIIEYNLHHVLGFDVNKIWFRFIDFKCLREQSSGRRIVDEEQKIIDYFDAKNGKLVEPLIKYGKVMDGNFKFLDETNKNIFEPSPILPDKPNSGDIQIVIDCVKHVDEAQYCLQKYKYEIVLLDYLLDKDDKDGNQEYGYQLLETLYDWHKGKKDRESKKMPLYTPGPHNRFFFMFISAFTTAVQERMLEQGFNRAEPGLWFIGDGACPTNTPYLFSYQLLLRMEHRLNDLRREYQGGFTTVIDVLKHVYMDNNVRQNAHEHFNHILYMRNKYFQLEKDLSFEDEKKLNSEKKNDGAYMMNMKSSLLVYSVFKVVHLFSGAFFEHLQHLVYLTAFGTIRQWEELWEEYVFVHNELERYDDIIGNDCHDGYEISDAIRKYIINRKENAY